MKKNVLRIATRKSTLALWQATFVQQALKHAYPALRIELVGLLTQADKLAALPLIKIGGKGLFVKELELALLEQRADIAVHSLKDLPAELPTGLMLATICEREEARDALVANHFNSLSELPIGARVGTSSLRRQCQLRALRPDLTLEPLRGNVDSRLGRLDDGQFEALVLAAAGLIRLQQNTRIRQYFAPDEVLPAVGQGAIGIECREDDATTREYLTVLDHLPTRYCVTAERACNQRLNGGCQVPIAAHGVLNNGVLQLRGLVGSPTGMSLLTSVRAGSPAEAETLGYAVAEDLLAQGADKILQL